MSDLTGGVFDGATLAQGNNLACFVFQLVQAEAPTVVAGLYANVTAALEGLAENVAGNLAGLGCPRLEEVDVGMYDVYPGYVRAKGV